MNYRPSAIKAAIALALTVLPGALYAGPVNDWACCTNWNNGSATVTGVNAAWQKIDLRHQQNSTNHVFIGDPNEIPPGVCRSIAIRWNVGVLLGKPDKYFRRLLAKSAQKNCNIDFTRNDVPNPDGSFDLLKVKPSK